MRGLTQLLLCLHAPNVKETIQFPARASGPQGQQAKTQNHFYPFPAGFHLIRSGHSSGEKGLCLTANAPTLCFNTGRTLLVLPLVSGFLSHPYFFLTVEAIVPQAASMLFLILDTAPGSSGLLWLQGLPVCSAYQIAVTTFLFRPADLTAHQDSLLIS